MSNTFYKLKRPVQELYGGAYFAVVRILIQHRRAVLAIAAALNRHGSLKGRRLAKLLALTAAID